MNSPEENDPLDALLHEQNVYLEDAGFTRRVVKSLPPPRRRRSWLRPFILLGATAIGSLLAVWWLPWKNLPAVDSSALLSLSLPVLLPWAVLLAVVASLVWGLIAALQHED
jgi:hypothetical protein